MVHGGDVYRNIVDYDFSVNLNPLGMPGFLKDELRAFFISTTDFLSLYPDYEYEKEREGIASYLNNTLSGDTTVSASDIIPGNGASELIMACLHALSPDKVFMPIPVFRGYERALDGKRVSYYVLDEKKDFAVTEDILDNIPKDAEMIILSNPNNPTGLLYDPEILEEILKKSRGVPVLLDECFIEMTDGESAVHFQDTYPNLIILRAFTKCFAIPGARVGYAVVKNPSYNLRIRRALPEWNISGMASKIISVIADHPNEVAAYFKISREFIREEREYLQTELEKKKIKVYPSDSNYVLIYYDDPELANKLLEDGMLIRDCSNYTGLGYRYFRIAVSRREQSDALLRLIF